VPQFFQDELFLPIGRLTVASAPAIQGADGKARDLPQNKRNRISMQLRREIVHIVSMLKNG
jgi:hypothetical protein